MPVNGLTVSRRVAASPHGGWFRFTETLENQGQGPVHTTVHVHYDLSGAVQAAENVGDERGGGAVGVSVFDGNQRHRRPRRGSRPGGKLRPPAGLRAGQRRLGRPRLRRRGPAAQVGRDRPRAGHAAGAERGDGVPPLRQGRRRAPRDRPGAAQGAAEFPHRRPTRRRPGSPPRRAVRRRRTARRRRLQGNAPRAILRAADPLRSASGCRPSASSRW